LLPMFPTVHVLVDGIDFEGFAPNTSIRC